MSDMECYHIRFETQNCTMGFQARRGPATGWKPIVHGATPRIAKSTTIVHCPLIDICDIFLLA